MSSQSESVRHPQRRGVSPASLVCRICGIIILLLVIFSAAALTVPRTLGYEVFHVVSGSMEPEIPVGSVAYVEGVAPEELKTDDIIAFNSEGSVIIHRVVTNFLVEGKFTTKGDANDKEDMSEVPYAQVIGRVVYHLPFLGQMLMIYSSNMGRIYVLCFAACGALLNILAGRLRPFEE